MQKRTPLALVLAVSACLQGSIALAQEAPVTLKFAHWVPPTHVLATQAIPNWISAIEAASGGTIKFATFPAGQLGKPTDHYDLAKDGIADVAWVNPGLNAGRFPVFAVAQLPMLVGDSVGGSKAMTEWYRGYEAQEMGDVKVCLAHMMYGSMLHTKRKVVDPQDLKGMKIRPSSSAEATLIRLAGGSAVPGANPQAREMIDRGVADGTTGVPGSQIAFGVDKAVKYHLAVQLSQPTWVLVMNKNKYASLSPRQKKAIDDNCTPDAAARFAEPMFKFEHAGVAELQKVNQVTMPTPAIYAKWKALAVDVKIEWAKEVAARNIDANRAYDTFMKTVAKHQAQIK
jgi:TRAP-type transport system periplasmic protein